MLCISHLTASFHKCVPAESHSYIITPLPARSFYAFIPSIKPAGFCILTDLTGFFYKKDSSFMPNKKLSVSVAGRRRNKKRRPIKLYCEYVKSFIVCAAAYFSQLCRRTLCCIALIQDVFTIMPCGRFLRFLPG